MRDEAPEPLEAVAPAPVGAAVQKQRVQAGVAGQHLPGGAGGRVAVEDALDVGAESGKHARSLSFCGTRDARRHVQHSFGHAAQDVDFFLRDLCPVEQLIQAWHEFFGCSGV